MNRETWYAHHRAQRIILRHTSNAMKDAMLYGTGITDPQAILREIAGERPGPKPRPWDVTLEVVKVRLDR